MAGGKVRYKQDPLDREPNWWERGVCSFCPDWQGKRWSEGVRTFVLASDPIIYPIMRQMQ